ncbi:MAG: hypothetical protein R3B84_21665 [Zavarzinella sp.]
MESTRLDTYGGIVCYLGQEKLMEQIMRGQIQLPDVERSLLNPFPPVLVPIWATGARTIVGLWKHWFSDRQPTFVEFYGTTVYGSRNMAFERGRTLTQVIYLQLCHSIMVAEGMSEEIRDCAYACGISDIDEAEELLMRAGDEKGFRSHAEFVGKLPLSFFDCDNQTDYTGDFPTNSVASSTAELQHCCVHEIHSGFQNLEPDYTLREFVAQNPNSPEWFRTTSQSELFEQLLTANDLEGAWMCLNSPGWTLANARQAITHLAARANDTAFSSLATTWVNLPFADDETI